MKKTEGFLETYSLDLTPEEEEIVKQGKLPEMSLPSSSQPTSAHNTPPSNSGDTTPPKILDGILIFI